MNTASVSSASRLYNYSKGLFRDILAKSANCRGTVMAEGYGGYGGQRGGHGRRGRGGGHRGWRGHHQGSSRSHWSGGEERSFSSGGSGGWGGGRGGRGGRGRGHPSGLRGKDIGLFYARKSKDREKRERSVVQMDHSQEQHLSQLLTHLRRDDTPGDRWRDDSAASQQPVRTGQDWFEQDGADNSGSGSSSQRFDSSGRNSSSAPPTGRNPQDSEKESWASETSWGDPKESCASPDAVLPVQNRDEALDERLKVELDQTRSNNNQYRRMQEFREKLPSYNMRQELLQLIHKNQVVVISGETGCGKTTQVAQFILDDMIERGQGSLCHVICTQPRRISAVGVAERVASERGERCGEGGSTGYSIRLENKLPRPKGSILYCTTGIILKRLLSDPYLGGVSHLILDEVHERDLLSDFLTIIVRDLLQKRPDLKLVLMSATLNADQFSTYFGNSPMSNIPGFTFPVEDLYLEDVLELTRYDPPEAQSKPQRRVYGRKRREEMEERMEREEEERQELREYLQTISRRYSSRTLDSLERMDHQNLDLNLTMELIKYITYNKPDGAILVFLPGWDQISKVNDMLASQGMSKSGKFRIIPLHSMMPTVNQTQVFERPPKGVRKVVLATNIAETSITIDDVVYVVDCGQVKEKNFDITNNLATLQPVWISKASAKQRRGRAGRVQPGVCYHLFSRLKESNMQEYQLPEILRTPLEELCLQIKLMKLGAILPFIEKAMSSPSLRAVQLAITNLKDLNALDRQENLTPLGYHLARLPVEPHIGKMILFGAIFSCLDPVLTVAASLGFKDPFVIPLGKEEEADRRRREFAAGSKSDHLMLINAFKSWERAKSQGRESERRFCWDNFLSVNTLKMLSNMKLQFAELLQDIGFVQTRNPSNPQCNKNSGNIRLVKAVICAGLYPNVAKVRGPKQHFRKRPPKLVTKHEKVQLHPKSVNADEKYFEDGWLIYHMKMKTTQVFLYDCTMISPYPLLFFGGDITIQKDGNQETVAVDNWIIFRAATRTAKLVKGLRHELDTVLQQKITRPGGINWDEDSKEGQLMRGIIQLITTEDSSQDYEEEDYNSDD
ncbi:PREDICTED: ATP-dependent RNA helicase DHX36-like [Branchiostoma belcheri]|uniref:ATP-dependent DNA/RNA helicase DHX36 n=1 Tax=Branchiostoma belcheri TaxID=7741 RepID=A0A6P4Z9Z4_BRABE|nr:PREDICTED: ATP-dependent RNA helicase DHX36-like [Branchiostoma belcheri]